jgi:hypothetical protein
MGGMRGIAMSLEEGVRSSLRRSLMLWDELIAELPEPALGMKLRGLRSNTIGAQLWCVVGARETYASAIRSGAWPGFSCSLDADAAQRKAAVRATLASSADVIRGLLDELETYVDARARFLVDLLEHEAAHQGQLIRYLYGLDLPIPAGWKARYALDA